ncbi:MAG: porin [Proteobacteria bacterium]|nr:porin [Pseudomonadota bacterium]
MFLNRTAAGSATMLVLSALTIVHAQTPTGDEADLAHRIQELQTRLETQQTQIKVQQGQLADLQAQLEALRATSKPGVQDSPRWTFTNGRPAISSSDGRNSLSVRALVQGDLGHYTQDPVGPLGVDYRRGSIGSSGNRENNGARDLGDGFNFRRARLGVEGVIARDFSYRFVAELGGAGTEGPTRINDAWLAYNGFAPISMQIGAFAPPANLEDSTSPEDQLFLERASSAELSRALAGADGRLGIGVRATGSRWFGALTLTGRTVNDAEVFDSQTAVVGRGAALLAGSEDFTFQLGLSGSYVIHPPDSGTDAPGARHGIRFRDRPELRIDGTRLIDTGTIDADHAYAAGVEWVARWRSLLLQGESFWFGIERTRPTALSDPRFSGYYLEGSWVLTGEPHRYNAATAAMQNPRPRATFSSSGGWGAWELALRYSHVDLNHHAGDPGVFATADAVRGGVQDILTFGLNWYLNANIRFLFDYSRVRIDRLNPAGDGTPAPFGIAPLTPPAGVQTGQEFNSYALRSQFSF